MDEWNMGENAGWWQRVREGMSVRYGDIYAYIPKLIGHQLLLLVTIGFRTKRMICIFVH